MLLCFFCSLFVSSSTYAIKRRFMFFHVKAVGRRSVTQRGAKINGLSATAATGTTLYFVIGAIIVGIWRLYTCVRHLSLWAVGYRSAFP